MIKIVIYREPYFLPDHSNTMPRDKRKNVEDFYADQRSIIRTKTTISDLVICNQFEYFCTFTFDKEKIDRYDMQKCRYAMQTWLHNSKNRHSPGLKYLVVPEKHKDGALHFHALISGYDGRYKTSGRKQNGRDIFNLTGWRFGYSTAVKIDNFEAVGHYMKKYITKDMPMIYGKRRYFSSNNLERPKKVVNDTKFRFLPPLFKKKVYSNQHLDIYTSPIV
jgi:hypothetical protein